MDHSATTKLNPEVLEAMMPYLTESFGNASSIYQQGQEARKAVELAREKVASAIGALPEEIYFTSSGTEADNWALRGRAFGKNHAHIVTTSIEHPAVMETCQDLMKQGVDVTYLPVDVNGFVTAEQVRNAIREDTVLVSVMTANNEIGTLEPIAEIGAVCRERGVVFHTDAVQAIGQISIDVKRDQIDMLSLSGHKFYGPKGIGALYIRKGVPVHPFVTGGHQEQGKRASTENVPGIVGLGSAISLAVQNQEQNTAYLQTLRDRTIQRLEKEIPHIRLNGDRKLRLPGHVNISFQYIEGESLLLMLDLRGIAASSGSACTSGSLDPSHVLLAIGLPHEIAHGSLRITYGIENTMEDVDYLVEQLNDVVQRLRDMSPLYPGSGR